MLRTLRPGRKMARRVVGINAHNVRVYAALRITTSQTVAQVLAALRWASDAVQNFPRYHVVTQAELNFFFSASPMLCKSRRVRKEWRALLQLLASRSRGHGRARGVAQRGRIAKHNHGRRRRRSSSSRWKG